MSQDHSRKSRRRKRPPPRFKVYIDPLAPRPRKKMKLSQKEKLRRASQISKASRAKKDWTARTLRIDALLSKEDNEAYQKFLRQPLVTDLQGQAWLRERGYQIGLSAVRNHRRQFCNRVAYAKQAAEMAHAFAEAARVFGPTDISDTCAFFVEQKMMETFFAVIKAQAEGEKFNASNWQDVQKTVGMQVRNREVLEKTRAIKGKNEPPPKLTQAEINERIRQSAEEMREIMGLGPEVDRFAKGETPPA
jgi:hypothetical protein